MEVRGQLMEVLSFRHVGSRTELRSAGHADLSY